MDNRYPLPRPKLPAGVRLDENVHVTMRDGVNIVVDIYRPEAEGQYPGILSTSAYFKGIQTCEPTLSQSIEAGAIFFFVQHGYIHVVAQARGSGLSQGQYNWYDLEEQKDGYELVEWIARQPWCNGNVGMIGESYFARIQWLIAGLQPPHLKCIVPYDGGMDDYRSRHEGGFNRMGFLTSWGGDVMMQCQWPGPIEGKLPPTNLFVHMATHPDDGPFYWERSGITNADKIRAPVLNLVLGGSHLHSRTQLAGYPKIKAPNKLVILPFNPAFPPNAVLQRSKPLNQYILMWFDKWLKGVETAIMEEPPIVIFDRATMECRYENEYPLARTKWTKFYLHSNSVNPANKSPFGILSRDPPINETPDIYTEPEAIGSVRSGKPVLAYATEPLTEDMRIWGPIGATLYGASTTTDTGWFVKLGDLAPDGKTTLLVTGLLKASYREVDDNKSAPGQPFHPFQNPVPPEANEIYEYQIEITPLFYTFKKGHKVWMQIASNDPDYMGRLNTVYTAEMMPVPCQNTIFHDKEHQSNLMLPIVPDAPIINTVPVPLSAFKLPMEDTAM